MIIESHRLFVVCVLFFNCIGFDLAAKKTHVLISFYVIKSTVCLLTIMPTKVLKTIQANKQSKTSVFNHIKEDFLFFGQMNERPCMYWRIWHYIVYDNTEFLSFLCRSLDFLLRLFSPGPPSRYCSRAVFWWIWCLLWNCECEIFIYYV